jgi:cytoskeletal protein CcmA (bactofilin family)
VATVVDKEARVSGSIDTSGDVTIAGRFEGWVRTSGAVTVLAGGAAVAGVHAGRVEVQGEIIGDVVAAERVEVAAGARIVGDVRAPAIELDPDGVIEGKVDRRLPRAEEPGGSRTTVKIRGPLARPARPTSSPPVAGAAAEQETPRAAPTAPRPAARVRLVPRAKSEGDE